MIDAGILPWPDGLHDQVARFRQGDLIACPLLVYVDVPAQAVWDASTVDGATSHDETPIALQGELLPPYAMITTQTCDIVDENRTARPRNPWIQVAPVYDADALPAGQHKQIEKHEVGHLFPLRGDPLPPGLWVADLRIEVPIGKGLLAGREPLRVLLSDKDTDTLARRLAARRQRPAVSTAVNDAVLVSLSNRLKRDQRARRADVLDQILHCRLDIIAGMRVEATIVQVICVTYGPPSAGIREWFTQWWQDAVLSAADLGVTLEHPRICRLVDLNGEEMQRTTEIDLHRLSPEAAE